MNDFPTMQNIGNMKKIFGEIRTAGIPKIKVGQGWLEVLGFKSKNDRPMIGVLKALSFIDTGQMPSDRWKRYRTHPTDVMAEAIVDAYSDLFDLYPDADRKDDEALRNFFTSRSTAGAATIKMLVVTFKGLTELAVFNTVDKEDSVHATDDSRGVIIKDKTAALKLPSSATGVTVNVNIQLQIAATEDATIYDKFFESLYKHVISREQK